MSSPQKYTATIWSDFSLVGGIIYIYIYVCVLVKQQILVVRHCICGGICVRVSLWSRTPACDLGPQGVVLFLNTAREIPVWPMDRPNHLLYLPPRDVRNEKTSPSVIFWINNVVSISLKPILKQTCVRKYLIDKLATQIYQRRCFDQILYAEMAFSQRLKDEV